MKWTKRGQKRWIVKVQTRETVNFWHKRREGVVYREMKKAANEKKLKNLSQFVNCAIV